MNPTVKKVISYAIPLLLGIGLLNWLFNQVDLGKILEAFKGANYSLVVLAGILALLSNVIRAARWNLMLKPLGYKPSLYNASLAVLIGYLTNLVFPRAGEVTRSVSLQKSDDVPFDKSFGAVIAERLVDVMVLLVLVGVNLLLEFDRISLLFEGIFPDFKLGWVLPSVLGIGLIFFLVFLKFKDKIFALPFLNKFKPFFEGLKAGFTGVLSSDRPGLFVAQSVLLWVLYYFISMLLCKSIGIGAELSPLAILTVLVMGTIGMAVPTMGGIGSYHILVGKIVTLYGLTNQDGVSLATFLHTMNGILFIVIFGVVALLLSALSKNRK